MIRPMTKQAKLHMDYIHKTKGRFEDRPKFEFMFTGIKCPCGKILQSRQDTKNHRKHFNGR